VPSTSTWWNSEVQLWSPIHCMQICPLTIPFHQTPASRCRKCSNEHEGAHVESEASWVQSFSFISEVNSRLTTAMSPPNKQSLWRTWEGYVKYHTSEHKRRLKLKATWLTEICLGSWLDGVSFHPSINQGCWYIRVSEQSFVSFDALHSPSKHAFLRMLN